MNSLNVLLLNDNSLDSLPASIGFMENLKELWLQHNQIVALPDEIGSLNSLVTLYLQYNSLKNVPESIGNLVNLKKLKLDHNVLYGLPESLCMETNGLYYYNVLEIFSVNNNSLCLGSYPACITPEELGNQTCTECPPNYFMVEGYCAWEEDYNILQNFLDVWINLRQWDALHSQSNVFDIYLEHLLCQIQIYFDKILFPQPSPLQ